ncbi:MAG TPA: hypothetical protein VK395_26920 [Gemmataceae bacterium]|nr:hypothetical protein [Gemmataceae bacterium]
MRTQWRQFLVCAVLAGCQTPFGFLGGPVATKLDNGTSAGAEHSFRDQMETIQRIKSGAEIAAVEALLREHGFTCARSVDDKGDLRLDCCPAGHAEPVNVVVRLYFREGKLTRRVVDGTDSTLGTISFHSTDSVGIGDDHKDEDTTFFFDRNRASSRPFAPTFTPHAEADH